MTTLPPELILACLQQLEPSDPATVRTLISTSLASSSLNALARSSPLWRPLLAHHYRRRAAPIAPTPPHDVDAFEQFRSRAEKDRRARSLVRDLQRPTNRLPLMEELRTSLGSEVIEELSDLAWCSEERKPETWLSLQYWAREGRKALLRDEAIRLWQEIAERDERGEEDEADFERGVNAFAAFRGLDPELLSRARYDISLHPDLVEAVAHPPAEGTERLKWLANQVCTYMLEIGLKPSEGGSFHNLDNHYVELVWSRAHDPRLSHGTLPMTLVSIFCSLIRRLPSCSNLRAKPIGFPGTVLAGLSYQGSDEWVYVNVFSRTNKIMSASGMTAMLREMGLDERPEFVQPASAREMCQRVARNILTSMRAGMDLSHESGVSSLYSVAHALFALTPRPSAYAAPDQNLHTTYVDWLTSLCQSEFPLDVPFLERHVLPELGRYGVPERRNKVANLCLAIREEDAVEKEKKWVSAGIKWRIGHVFVHRLYGYTAVIRGWDDTCRASETWIQQMQIDRLPFGRHQPFYHVIVDDGSSRYIAQENVTDLSIPTSALEVLIADESFGRYFRKRGKDESGRWCFVKSWEVEAEYPDS
ncbi:hypothetical protein JCM1841_006913 [Sporobolomyces salmonicolor]